MKKDLISRKALLKRQRLDNELVLVVDVMDIRQAPAVKAAEIIFCDECMFCKEIRDEQPSHHRCIHPNGLRGNISPNETYCVYSRRKDT